MYDGHVRGCLASQFSVTICFVCLLVCLRGGFGTGDLTHDLVLASLALIMPLS